MNTKLVSTACILSFAASLTAGTFRLQNPMLFGMTIQFPQTIQETPDIRAYCSGHIIKGNVDHKNKTLFFSVPEDRYKTTFTLLITNAHAIGCTATDNTIQHLKIDTKHPYKLYVLTLKERVITSPVSTKEPRTEFIWDIERITLPADDGRIPDNTVIVCYNPDFIDKLEGGNAVTLPTLYVKDNIISLVGSESKLHEKSVECLLASLDYDAIHATIKEHVKPCYAS
ncbi:MAG TPA: hypothetical protein VLG71_03275, partial [Candidatus Limnocylindria bacterium]|nr:hypothetical protein [Candidatus Limnocylindria bacterium]